MGKGNSGYDEDEQPAIDPEKCTVYTGGAALALFLGGLVFLSISFGRNAFFFQKDLCESVRNISTNFMCSRNDGGAVDMEANLGGQVSP